MSRLNTPKTRSRRTRPAVEGLETREVPAAIAPTWYLNHVDIYKSTGVQYAINTLYGPGVTITEPDGSKIPTPQPTAHEVAREYLTLGAVADYTVGTPRFAGQASTIHGVGRQAASNQFAKGKPQLLIFPNANPNLPATGTLSVITSSYLDSGAVLIIDLTETKVNAAGQPDPNGTFVRSKTGLPEHFTWALDSTGGTLYTGSTGTTPNPAYAAQFNAGITPTVPAFLPGPTGTGTGAGTLDITYAPGVHNNSLYPAGSGVMAITARGLTNLVGINNTAAQGFS